MDESKFEGEGTRENPYKIKSLEDIKLLNSCLHKCYELTSDIDYNEIPEDENLEDFLISKIYGIFYGNGHTIEGLSEKPIFERILGTVENLNIEDCSVSASEEIGILAKFNEGLVKKVEISNSEIEGDEIIGGVVGFCKGDIENCHFNSGDIKGKYYVGGIVGSKEKGSIVDCSVNQVSLDAHRSVGGIMGRYSEKKTDKIKIKNSGCNSVQINAHNKNGGIVGCTKRDLVENCYVNDSKLEFSGKYCGGIVGKNKGEVSKCEVNNTYIKSEGITGGIVGYHKKGRVSDCRLTEGMVESKNCVGSLAGINGENCEVSSSIVRENSIIGWSSVGSIVGKNQGTVTDSYAKTKINKNCDKNNERPVGEIIGGNLENGRVENCYYCGLSSYPLIYTNCGEAISINSRKDIEEIEKMMVANTI